jgi:hypothetical protein
MPDRRKNWMKLSVDAKDMLRNGCRQLAEAVPIPGMTVEERQKAALELVQLGLLQLIYDDRGNVVGYEPAVDVELRKWPD